MRDKSTTGLVMYKVQEDKDIRSEQGDVVARGQDREKQTSFVTVHMVVDINKETCYSRDYKPVSKTRSTVKVTQHNLL